MLLQRAFESMTSGSNFYWFSDVALNSRLNCGAIFVLDTG